MNIVNGNDFVNSYIAVKPDDVNFWTDFILGAMMFGLDKGIKIIPNLPNISIELNNEILGSILVESSNKNVIEFINMLITGNANYKIE